MDQHARAQIRLILEDADARTKKAVDDRLKAIYADHAARGLLQSGATVKVAIGGIEEIASKFITGCIDQVATIAKDMEAFAMIEEVVEGLLKSLGGRVESAAAMATGNSRLGSTFESVFKAAEMRFAESRQQLRRQLEIQRFTFTVPYNPPPKASLPAAAAAKNRGGGGNRAPLIGTRCGRRSP